MTITAQKTRYGPEKEASAGPAQTGAAMPQGRSGAPTGARPRARRELVEQPVERLEAEVIELSGRLAAGTYELLVLVGELDQRGSWATWGALSCAAWLADLCDIDVSTAHSQVRVARAMRHYPQLDADMTSGDVSYSAIQAGEQAGPGVQPETDVRTGSGTQARPSVQAEMVIHVTEDGNRLPDGTPLSNHAVTALLPEAFVSLLMHDAQRQPVDASPRRRTPTRRQRRVLDERHHECQQPGCHAEAFLQYDHIQPYANGGPTVVANLQRLCGPHNRARQAP